jgi:hypothetical protein
MFRAEGGLCSGEPTLVPRLSDLAIELAANNHVHIGSSFFLGRISLRGPARNYVGFASEADNAKLTHANRMSPTDPKRTYSFNSPEQHLGGPA